ncbi:TetR/AcrR family transcriptional regulator [Nocardia sp. NPDC057663]|uniref:TetR/AcrR family transcriptional regulator n=1 Tax=Nocardia sp. NPDC057663 TaxID=3346201 RepID=UPI00366F7792
MPESSKPKRRTQAERVAESTERIMAAAIELIAEQGYEATTMGAIADRAGFARSMVNSRFGSKAGLLDALFEEHWINELVTAVDAAEDGLSAVLSMIERLREFVRTEPVRLRAFLVVSFEAVGPSSIPAAQVTGPLSTLDRAMSAALRRGMEDHTVTTLDDPDFHAARLIDIGVGMAYRWAIDPDGYPFANRLVTWKDECARTYRA